MKKIFSLFVAIVASSGLWAKGDYLSFTATGASSVELNYEGTVVYGLPNIEYSYDQQTWNFYTADYIYGNAVLNLSDGQTVYMRGCNPNYFGFREDAYFSFRMTGSIAAGGDLMTLVDSTGQTTTIPYYASFYKLFEYCTSLTKAPKLTATTLTSMCYALMFRGCTNLQYIEVSCTSWIEYAFINWVYQVASTGVFVKPQELPTIFGDSNIPTGWQVENKGTGTDLIETNVFDNPPSAANKIMQNGRLLILRDGKVYSAMGQEL